MYTKYDDILNLKHPESKRHPRMSPLDRAAQFAPFAALTGYDDRIENQANVHIIENQDQRASIEETDTNYVEEQDEQ